MLLKPELLREIYSLEQSFELLTGVGTAFVRLRSLLLLKHSSILVSTVFYGVLNQRV